MCRSSDVSSPSSGCAEIWGGCAGGLVLPNHQHTLKMGTELFPVTSENLHTLTQLSARENLFKNHELLGNVLFRCLEFLSDNKVIIFLYLKIGNYRY
jgi:hypothetical protein